MIVASITAEISTLKNVSSGLRKFAAAGALHFPPVAMTVNGNGRRRD